MEFFNEIFADGSKTVELETKTKNFLLKVSSILDSYYENKKKRFMLYPKRRNFHCPKVCQLLYSSPGASSFHSSLKNFANFGGQNMKIIKKYIYPHKSQTIYNTLAKKSFRNSIPAVSCMDSKIYSC